MVDELDYVALYARDRGLTIRSRTLIVEGLSDVELFTVAADLEHQRTGVKLLDDRFTIVAAGEGDMGGARGVARTLIALKELSRGCLSSDGRPRYRFVALLDNDEPGRTATNMALNFDASMVEYRDIFRLRPRMPVASSMHPSQVRGAFEQANAAYKTLKWEAEDLLSKELMDRFALVCPDAVRQVVPCGDKTHRELTRDGKRRLRKFVTDHATREELEQVVDVMKAMRSYMGLPTAGE